MKIRTKLSIQFSFIVAAILILFSIFIYYSSINYRNIEYKNRLKDAIQSIVNLYTSMDDSESDISSKIRSLNITLYSFEILILNQENQLEFNIGESTKSINTDLFKEIEVNKKHYFTHGEKEGYGMIFIKEGKEYLILILAQDIYGFGKIKNLLQVLIIALILSVIVTSYIAWVYAGLALKPISEVVSEVDNITANNLYSRVKEGNGKDEIAHLAVTFNKMLERLDNAFRMQKSFVSNASHELRTPLTSISGEIEVALLKERKANEYKNVLSSIHEEIKNLSKLSNGLLELAQASIDISNLKKEFIRIDELIWQVRSELLKHKKDYSIIIHFEDNLDDEKKLTILGNEQLIKATFLNLMDNSCKYSDNKQVEISVGYENKYIKLIFLDKGIGISKEELKHIFEPFYRAENAALKQGHGIGLPLVDKIIQLHDAKIEIESELNIGTKINLKFPISI
jgi:two-component system sensor histidine kinase ArlS